MAIDTETVAAPQKDPIQRKCQACGSTIEEFQYQMRAADEAHTSVWSCGKCPLDPANIRFSDPGTYQQLSYPRILHKRSVSEPVYIGSGLARKCTYVEMFLSEVPTLFSSVPSADNVRCPCVLPSDGSGRRIGGHYYAAGVYAGLALRVRASRKLSPRCKIYCADVYEAIGPEDGNNAEKDGTVKQAKTHLDLEVFLYSKDVMMRRVHSIIVRLEDEADESLRRTLVVLHSLQQSWPSIRSFVPRDQLASINNLSPRAWDTKRIQRRDAIYSPKVDGERAYVLIYQRVAHIFRKGKGYPHIGWRVLGGERASSRPIVIDVENTLSHGCFLIDMLTDVEGNPAPRTRAYGWSLAQFNRAKSDLGLSFVSDKPYFSTLKDAEREAETSMYPTDGVVALWGNSTTARKMKQERSIELLLRQEGTLVTSDGDVVIKEAPLPAGLEPGCIVEVRFRLCRDGKSIISKPLFQRTDKAGANSTSAVRSVLSSFSSVLRDDETRRRNALMWCESLKSALMKEMLQRCGNRKIILDVGTGTGQSLDILTPDRGVSYILVEPDPARCDMLKRRAGIGKVHTEPREILSNVRHLKSGSQTYMIICCSLSDIASDEQLMASIHSEIAVATAFFSAHYVVPDLYGIATYWSIPVVGCVYPYDGVQVGEHLIDALGVEMKRQSISECKVKWGGDKEYMEPYTTTSEYQSFAHVMNASEILQVPSPELDEDVFNICNKVYAIMSE